MCDDYQRLRPWTFSMGYHSPSPHERDQRFALSTGMIILLRAHPRPTMSACHLSWRATLYSATPDLLRIDDSHTAVLLCLPPSSTFSPADVATVLRAGALTLTLCGRYHVDNGTVTHRVPPCENSNHRLTFHSATGPQDITCQLGWNHVNEAPRIEEGQHVFVGALTLLTTVSTSLHMPCSDKHLTRRAPFPRPDNADNAQRFTHTIVNTAMISTNIPLFATVDADVFRAHDPRGTNYMALGASLERPE